MNTCVRCIDYIWFNRFNNEYHLYLLNIKITFTTYAIYFQNNYLELYQGLFLVRFILQFNYQL